MVSLQSCEFSIDFQITGIDTQTKER